MNLKDTYNRIAKDWHKDHKDDDWWKEGTGKFIELVRPQGKILDVGCGAGTKSKYLVSKGFDVTGIDVSQGMLDIAKKEVPQGTFKVMDLADVEDLEGRFDAIFAQAVLLHVPKKDFNERVKGLAEKLKEGGYLYIALKEVKDGRPEEEIRTENDYGYDYQRFFSYYTMEEIKKAMMDAGLDVIFELVAPAGNTRWLQAIGKK